MIRAWWRVWVDALFPPLCVVCGDRLEQGEEVFCTHCRWDLPLTDYWNRLDNTFARRMAGRVPFEQASALLFFSHQGGYRQMIHRMKYGGRRDVARCLGLLYGGYLKQSLLYRSVDGVVGVPLHALKRIKRGYNQSQEFGRGVAEGLGVEYVSGVLVRIRSTRTQARMEDVEAREKNVRGAFSIKHADRAAGRHLLLVDDVFTTGATLEAAALALVNGVAGIRLSLGAIAMVGSG